MTVQEDVLTFINPVRPREPWFEIPNFPNTMEGANNVSTVIRYSSRLPESLFDYISYLRLNGLASGDKEWEDYSIRDMRRGLDLGDLVHHYACLSTDKWRCERQTMYASVE